MGNYQHMVDALNEQALQEFSRSDLGVWNFESIIEDLRRIRVLLESLDQMGGEWIPNEKRGAVDSSYSELVNVLERIRTFNRATPDPETTNRQIIQSILNLKDAFLMAIAPYIRVDLGDIAKARSEIENQLMLLNDMKSALEKIIIEWDQRQSDERLRNSEEGTSEASTFFDTRALEHKALARKFGWWTIGVTATLILWITVLQYLPVFKIEWDSTKIVESIFNNIPHLMLLALASFAIGLLIRNYRINQHLAVLNQTKATTLKAGESFVRSVKEASSRDIILEIMVKSAFALGETGYLQGDQERPIIESPNLSSIIHAVAGSPVSRG